LLLGINTKTSEEVAIKLESTKTRFPQLIYEANLYKSFAGKVGFPIIWWHGVEGDYNCMVMEMLGPCLEDMFKYCKRKFTIKTTCMLADSMISRMETMHAANYIHRDIKPDNFLIGTGRTQNTVYVIDFGLSKRYIDPKSGMHIKYDDTKSLTGTARYASTNAHRGLEQSRRDDLESIGMVLVYFLKGVLPWQGLAGDNKKAKYDRIKECKINTTME
jgi:serine/threonine protein kinase